MKFITREACLIFIKDYYNSKITFPFISALFLCVIFGIYIRNTAIFVGLSVLIFSLCFVYAFIVRSKSKNIEPTNFYIVEDTVVSFKKRLPIVFTRGGIHLGKKFGFNINYIYKFNKYGKYVIERTKFQPEIEIPLHNKMDITHLEVERLSSESSNKGDAFYLLICEENKKIIKPFYKYYFEIKKEDFNLIDGKYYLK